MPPPTVHMMFLRRWFNVATTSLTLIQSRNNVVSTMVYNLMVKLHDNREENTNKNKK